METLRQRTDPYLSWVNAYTKNQEIPITWAEKGVRKKDALAPLRTRLQRQGRTGVYYVLKSMEQGPSFRIVKPKFPVDDPNWRIVAAQRSRYTHLYFYIIDEVLGPFSMRIGAFLPFYATYYLNGHDLIAPMLPAEGVRFRRKENAFVSVAHPVALQAAADRIDPRRIQERLEHWTFLLGPKFSRHEREGMDLRRYYYLSQVEHAQNIVLEKLAQPCRLKSQRMAGIRIENDRIIRLLEILMHSSSQLGGLRAAEIHQSILQAHQLRPEQYTRNQLAYDLRKLRAHGLTERPDNRYAYALSDYGRKAAALLVIVRNRILRPIAGSLLARPPKSALKPNSTLQAQYRRTTQSFNDLIDLLKAA